MTKQSLRLRVFAGPNGSGKSTIIHAVKNHKVQGIPVDFGIYINADDIAKALRNNKFSFERYRVKVTRNDFESIALSSGLVGENLTTKQFISCFKLERNRIKLINIKEDERLAQIIAYFLRKKLLQEKRKFSFETVFSHPSKLDIMNDAVQAGYKVYLYFVSTEDPEINKYRVKKVRVAEGGHDVPEDKIESRYYRSLDLLYQAAQLSYQSYFFDNSRDGEDFQLVAHFKKVNGKKVWDKINKTQVPRWFVKYYSGKVKKKN